MAVAVAVFSWFEGSNYVENVIKGRVNNFTLPYTN